MLRFKNTNEEKTKGIAEFNKQLEIRKKVNVHKNTIEVIKNKYKNIIK